jgi:hypothetical protein
MSFILNCKEKISDFIICLRQQGLKKTWKIYGWKAFSILFVYYLVRDTFLYILVPLLIATASQK